MLTSEAFPGLDLKGKKEKKEKEQGGREANSTGKSNNRLGAGCFPNLQRVCPRGFFLGRGERHGRLGTDGPHAPAPDAQGSQASQILGASSPHTSGISFGQKNQERKAILCVTGHSQASSLVQEYLWKEKNPKAAFSPQNTHGGQTDPRGPPNTLPRVSLILKL